ncbi:hypothetical protein K438DRAFT_1786642 [Mycena galopus ATCC 62051]|nr:hypothetical protein K438DRAFT_1786642 [Mycena galopus ATCC 62051]
MHSGSGRAQAYEVGGTLSIASRHSRGVQPSAARVGMTQSRAGGRGYLLSVSLGDADVGDARNVSYQRYEYKPTPGASLPLPGTASRPDYGEFTSPGAGRVCHCPAAAASSRDAGQNSGTARTRAARGERRGDVGASQSRVKDLRRPDAPPMRCGYARMATTVASIGNACDGWARDTCSTCWQTWRIDGLGGVKKGE